MSLPKVRMKPADLAGLRAKLPSPTVRSLELLRKLGYKCLYVEVPNRHIELPNGEDFVYKTDLFGWADIIALKPRERMLVQTTSSPNVSARVNKIQASEWFEWVKQSEFAVHVHGWDTKAPWGYRIIDMTAKDAEGKWVYATRWDTILRLGKRAKNRPRHQQDLNL